MVAKENKVKQKTSTQLWNFELKIYTFEQAFEAISLMEFGWMTQEMSYSYFETKIYNFWI